MIRGPKKKVSVTMPEELYQILKTYAVEDFRSVPSEIRQILKFYIHFREQNEAHRAKGL